jgi:hypothetical protein
MSMEGKVSSDVVVLMLMSISISGTPGTRHCDEDEAALD